MYRVTTDRQGDWYAHNAKKMKRQLMHKEMSMCSSNWEEVVEALDSHDSGEDHDTLYPHICTPVCLRPRLTLPVHASTIMLLGHRCWSAEEKSLSAEIELR